MTAQERQILTTKLAGLTLPPLEEIQAEQLRRRRNKLATLFPDSGPLRRELYPRHVEFFDSGAQFRQRCFMAGNRTGKTTAAAVETTYHLTGQYPDWWKGHRFHKPVLVWAAGDTATTTRDIIQKELIGPFAEQGTGTIPGDLIVDAKLGSGIKEAVEVIYVRHVSGRMSEIRFKSYDQGRKAWQGTKPDFLWLDEEPPADVYEEALTRTMSTTPGGASSKIVLTFTPLSGYTEVVQSFLDNQGVNGKYLVQCSWEDCPHLSPADCEELWNSYAPYQREARKYGRPTLGEGCIYPVSEDTYKVAPFAIPDHWLVSYSMDVGWNVNAVLWRAWDRDTDTFYFFDEFHGAQAPPIVVAEAIKSKGAWIRGVIDPASFGRGQADGEQLIAMYQKQGLDVQAANNRVELGIQECFQRLSLGKLKIFATCTNLLRELPLYRREKGQVVKKDDHFCDAMRYGTMSGNDVARSKKQYAVIQQQKEDLSSLPGFHGGRGFGFGGGGYIG